MTAWPPWVRFLIGILKEHIMLTTLAYSASLPAIAIGLMYYVSACSGLVY
jgi:hypothetical protein